MISLIKLQNSDIRRSFMRRLDGTPKCITVDFQTLEDNTVTIRDRDTTEQKRVKAENIMDIA